MVLHLTFTSSNWMHVSINNLTGISHELPEMIQLVRPGDGRSGYFGLMVNYMNFTVKHLYVSGSKISIGFDDVPEVSELSACGREYERTILPETTLVIDDVQTTNISDHDDIIRQIGMIGIAGIALAIVIVCALIICARTHRKKELVKAKKTSEARHSREIAEKDAKLKALEEQVAQLEKEKSKSYSIEPIELQPGSPGFGLANETSQKPLDMDESKTDPGTPMTPMTHAEGVPGRQKTLQTPIIEGYEMGTGTSQGTSVVQLSLDIPHAAFGSHTNLIQNEKKAMDGDNT
eukprot:130119_1